MSTCYPIAGGMFGEAPKGDDVQKKPPFLCGTHLKLFNARSAIDVLCSMLQPDQIWIPSFICASVPAAVPAQSKIHFYPISTTLQIEDPNWVNQLNRGDLVVFTDYFGFDLHQEVMQTVKDRGAWILQDAAQALLSSFERPFADFVLYSPRKFIGIPDGGILESKCQIDFSSIHLQPAPKYAEKNFLHAFANRTCFDRDGQTPWFEDYQKAEQSNCIGPYSMSNISKKILSNGMDYHAQKELRRKNFKYLCDHLSEIGVFRHLPSDTVPMGFPILVENRDRLQSALFQHEIYCPIHWKQTEFLPEGFTETKSLCQNILTLLCDQRISESHLACMIKTIRKIV